MVHGARRESLGGWNEISYRGIFGSISNLTNNESTKLQTRKLEAAESPFPRPRDARDATGRTHESLSKTHFWQTIERHAAPVSLSRSALTYGSHWRGYSRWAPCSAPPSCTGAQLPTWTNLIRTCANNQCAPPSTRQPFCVCVQRARMPSRRHLRPAGGRFFSVSRDDRESTQESPRDRSE
jgi:hypothetical protein